MLTSLPMIDYIVLGEAFWFLRAPERAPDQIAPHIALFINQLAKCELTATLATAKPKLDLFSQQQLFRDVHGNLFLTQRGELATIMSVVEAALTHEASQRQMIALKTGEVTARLRNLPSTLTLNEAQLHLLDETIRCCECEAYRAGAVMGWNLAFDYIRQWVFDNRLVDFNAGLGAANPKRTAIANYDEFSHADAPTEAEFLRACAPPNANIIGGRLFNSLSEYLRQRNGYAHASQVVPSMPKTNAYIEHLIDIITGPPFNKP